MKSNCENMTAEKPCFYGCFFSFVFFILAMSMVGCSIADGDPIDDGDNNSDINIVKKSSSSSDVAVSSSSTQEKHSQDSLLNAYVSWVKIPASSLQKGSVTFSVDSFSISQTEVTQSLYEQVVGEIPTMDKVGDSIAVANVNWYDAVLFCNALSKRVGLDTAYVYSEILDKRYLEGLSIRDSVSAVRLPTEIQWEVAYRAGTATTYYWGTASASQYAYYGRTSGPSEVGQFLPNAYGLFDMGGNVKEWVQDWYGTFPSKNTQNYSGATSGTLRVIRGGGWSDKAAAMAASEREKKDPLYQSQMLGFRITVGK